MTFAELRAWIDAHGFAATSLNSDMTSVQSIAINSAYRRLLGLRRWPFLEATGTAVTVVGDETVDVSGITDLKSIDSVRCEVGTEYDDVEFMPANELRRRLFLYRDNGKPLNWTQRGGDLYVYPRPDRVYTLTLDYIIKVNDLSAGTDEPVFHSDYHDILGWSALKDIGYRERDWNQAQYAENEYRARLKEMENYYGVRQRQNATHVAHSDFWSKVGWVS